MIDIPQDESAAAEGSIDRVLNALSEKQWDFRTVDGIAKEVGLPKNVVRRILEDGGNSELIGKSTVPDRRGRNLYYLKKRGPGTHEFLRRLRLALSKSV